MAAPRPALPPPQADGDAAAEAAAARQQQRGGGVPVIVRLPAEGHGRAAALGGGIDGALVAAGDAALRATALQPAIAQLSREPRPAADGRTHSRERV